MHMEYDYLERRRWFRGKEVPWRVTGLYRHVVDWLGKGQAVKFRYEGIHRSFDDAYAHAVKAGLPPKAVRIRITVIGRYYDWRVRRFWYNPETMDTTFDGGSKVDS